MGSSPHPRKFFADFPQRVRVRVQLMGRARGQQFISAHTLSDNSVRHLKWCMIKSPSGVCYKKREKGGLLFVGPRCQIYL
jgi:hypothetical protein